MTNPSQKWQSNKKQGAKDLWFLCSSLQVNLDSPAEMAHPVVPVVKEREATQVLWGPREPPWHQQSQRETREILDFQVQLRTPSLSLHEWFALCLKPLELIVPLTIFLNTHCIFVCGVQVHQVFQVRKASLVSLVIPDCRDQMDALDSLDHQVCVPPYTNTHMKTLILVQVGF